LQRARFTECRLQGSTEGEGAWSGGLSSHSGLLEKFPVLDPSGSSQGVSPMNPGPELRAAPPRPRPVLFFWSDWLGNSPRLTPPRRNPLPALIGRRGGAGEPTTVEHAVLPAAPPPPPPPSQRAARRPAHLGTAPGALSAPCSSRPSTPRSGPWRACGTD
jgi:hypothetical protein